MAMGCSTDGRKLGIKSSLTVIIHGRTYPSIHGDPPSNHQPIATHRFTTVRCHCLDVTFFTLSPLLSSFFTTTPPGYHQSICCARQCNSHQSMTNILWAPSPSPSPSPSHCPLQFITSIGRRASADSDDFTQGLIETTHHIISVVTQSLQVCIRSVSRCVTFLWRMAQNKLPIIGPPTIQSPKYMRVFQGLSCHGSFSAISSLPKVIVDFDHSLRKLFSQGHKPTRMIQYDVDLLRPQTQLLRLPSPTTINICSYTSALSSMRFYAISSCYISRFTKSFGKDMPRQAIYYTSNPSDGSFTKSSSDQRIIN